MGTLAGSALEGGGREGGEGGEIGVEVGAHLAMIAGEEEGRMVKAAVVAGEEVGEAVASEVLEVGVGLEGDEVAVAAAVEVAAVAVVAEVAAAVVEDVVVAWEEVGGEAGDEPTIEIKLYVPLISYICFTIFNISSYPTKYLHSTFLYYHAAHSSS